MYPLPVSVWALVAISVVGLPGLTVAVLWVGGLLGGVGRRRTMRLAMIAAIGWTTWAVLSSLLAAGGVYRLTPSAVNPLIGVAVAGATSIALLFTRIPVVSRILARPDMLWWMSLPHILRIAGGSAFLLTFALGHLPAIFALPAGLGDIAIGVEAIFVARSLRRGRVGRQARWFNILGLVDMAFAVTIGFLAGPGPTRLVTAIPTTDAIALLPLVLIPTVVVPVAVTLHIVSLTRLRAATRAPDAVAGSAPSAA